MPSHSGLLFHSRKCQVRSFSTMMKPRQLRRALALAILLGALPISADTVQLRNGQTLEGTVVRQNRATVYLRIGGAVQSIPKSTIRRVLYGDAAAAALLQKRREDERRARAVQRQKLIDEERRRAEEARLTREEVERSRKEDAERQRVEAARLKRAEEERRREEADRKKEEAERKREVESSKKEEPTGGKSTSSKSAGERRTAMLRRKEEGGGRADSVSPLGALMYSAMLPGWGQWRTQRRPAAGAYGALAAGSLALVYERGRLYRNALRDYSNLNNPFGEAGLLSAALGAPLVPSAETLANPAAQAAYSNIFEDQRAAADRQYGNYRKAGLFFGALYFMNLADAYFMHPAIFGKGTVTTDPLGAALWSAAFPGLGQWRSGRRGEGILYGFLFSVAAFTTYDSHREYLNAKRVYENTNNPFSGGTLAASAVSGRSLVPGPLELQNPVTAVAYDLQFKEARAYTDRKYTTYRMALVSAAALYMWAAADAFLFHPGTAASGGVSPAALGPAFSGVRLAVVPGDSSSRTLRAEGEVALDFRF